MKQRSLLAALVSVIASTWVMAQPAPPKPPVPSRPPVAGGQSGGSGQLEPARVRQALYDTIRQQLDVTDAQWDAILPKLEKAREAQANMRSGAGIGIGRAQGGAARVQMPPDVDTPLGHAMSDLRAALGDKDVTADELNKKMTAVREAREKAKEELKKAQEEIKATLTPRQEAVLMTLGQLE
jgi:Spy/CpxP family protein refolding chaperone